jgi:hypothetical protein
MDSWSIAVIFTLAFLGLAAIVFLIVFVFIAYRHEISFSVKAYPGGKTLPEMVKAEKKNEPLP